jgi:phage-related protein
MVQSSSFKDIKLVCFYRSGNGRDILTLQLSWPLGMPLARKLETDLWEIRSKLNMGIVRIIFTIRDDNIVLLHGFIKKSRKMPLRDLRVAKQRMGKL